MKDIPGYEGIYSCDEFGNIYSMDRYINRKTKRLKIALWHLPLKKISPCIRRDGYLGVHLHKNDRGKSFLVHRLIAKTFLSLGVEEINHIDGNKKNNRLDNLEISNRSENIKHAFRLGLKNHKREKHPKFFIDKAIEEKVMQLLIKGLSQQKIADMLHISQASVSTIKLNNVERDIKQ
jgi:hypothetical protein